MLCNAERDLLAIAKFLVSNSAVLVGVQRVHHLGPMDRVRTSLTYGYRSARFTGKSRLQNNVLSGTLKRAY